jgi:putative CocE/NonD family hydrolase
MKNLLAVMIGVAGVVAFYFGVHGENPWFWAAGPPLVLTASFISANRTRVVLAAVIALAVPVFLIVRAGPVGSLAWHEWWWLSLLAMLLFLPLASLGWLWRQRRRFVSVVAALVFLVAVPIHAMKIRIQVSPVLLQSLYIPMRDGTRVAIDVYLPRNLGPDEQIPAALHQTRYHRNFNWVFPYNLVVPPWTSGADRLTAARIAWVKVDARGSGASEGSRPSSFSNAEIADGSDIADWIIAQPWSDGSIITEGISYVGTTAEFMLSNRHPAVKGAMPAFSLYDGYRDIVWPGGLYLEKFADTWSLLNTSLDANHPERAMKGLEGIAEGVRPVDEDKGGEELAAIVAGRTGNYVPNQVFGHLEYADSSYQGINLGMTASWTHKENILASGAPMLMISGWYDGAYANGSIRRFLNTPNPGSKLILGPWDHGSRQSITPCKDDPEANTLDYFGTLIDLVNHLARGQQTGFSDRAPVSYYTMCGRGWQESIQWPPQGMRQQKLFLAENQSLENQIPSPGESVYPIDFTAQSATGSRWVSYTNLNGVPIEYPDRAERDLKLLVFDSAPLDHGLEITGHPVISLYVSANSTDAGIFVYLEDVGPDGDVRYITEGQIRAIHRDISTVPLPFRQIGLNRSFSSKDARRLVPNEVFELSFSLLPVSYFVRPGRSIRIAIAGADNDHFKVPEGNASEMVVYSGTGRPSQLILPVR